MPGLLEPVKALPASNESTDSSDSEQQSARRSYDFSSGVPEEPITSDEDSDDSGAGRSRFSRVFVVNPDSDDSSSEPEDNADSGAKEHDDKKTNS
ncbi:hypothetical protein PYW08_015425 [Mythimna loreyi]|uniref:Uncharacterized protein n=1 Tax=Mythimna loreyi TaxID=667449 RepID=A0ACC2QVL8_9NEOP|nr:hypothetical protein PYW08_015425 [Mythimna loreyi]